jgi:hypothetical protein
MLRVGFANIRPEREARLRDWLKELGERQEEVVETFRRETIRHEQVFIVQSADGPLLVYAIEAEDHEVARKVYESSTLEIDKQHGAVLSECLAPGPRLSPLFECKLPGV